MRLVRPLLRLIVGLAVSANALVAQQPLLPGTRIRVTAPALGVERQLGTVVTGRPETLVVRFRNSNAPYSIPASAISAVEVSLRRNTRRALAIGLAAGAAVGVVAGYVQGDDPPCTPPPNDLFFCLQVKQVRLTAREKAQVFGLLGAALGAGIGALVGASERWRRAPGWGASPRLGLGSGQASIGMILVF
jgi:hypothetical protein